MSYDADKLRQRYQERMRGPNAFRIIYVPGFDDFEGQRARDDIDADGRMILDAVSTWETLSDGSQVEIWYVP